VEIKHGAVAIIPCENLDESRAFYERIGFAVTSLYPHQGYCVLHDSHGASIHLTRVEAGWIDPERNVHGVYFYTENVRELAGAFGVRAETEPWGLVEFAVSDPGGTLVRIGWPC
jgi:catechol 2,3-dioxygenase-like lactoylglutathione lyase family enzyme